MASISKRGKSWQARISFKDHDGTYHQKAQNFKTKKAATEYAVKVEADIDKGILPADLRASHIFAEYFFKWYEDFKQIKISPRTQQRYVITYHELQDYFKKTTIEQITRRDYQKFITEYGSCHAKDTVQKVNSLVRACVSNAIYEDIIIKDFTKDVEIVYDAKRSRHIEYLNTEEMSHLTNYVFTHLNHNFTSNQMILTAIYTGMRLGEIQGLTWDDVNFNFKAISVKHSFNERDQKIIPTKTKSSMRIIRINQELINVLTELQKHKRGKFVFTNQYKSVPTSAAVNKQLKSILKTLKIERDGFHFHSLRHTHVAYLLSKGMDLYAISKRLGHSDIGTTTRVYSYLIEEYKAKTDNQIETLLDKITVSPGNEKSGLKIEK